MGIWKAANRQSVLEIVENSYSKFLIQRQGKRLEPGGSEGLLYYSGGLKSVCDISFPRQGESFWGEREQRKLSITEMREERKTAGARPKLVQ